MSSGGLPGYVIAVVEGPSSPRDVELHTPLDVGRDADAGLSIEDEQISRRHARLAPAGGGVLVTDLGSRNGTLVNGKRIEEPTLARTGDRIELGQTTLEVQVHVQERARAEFVLALVRGADDPREVPLAQTLEIGRDPTLDLVLADEQVSRRHARLVMGEDGVLVEDLDSRNGVLVNGRRIRRPTMIEPGDRLVVGETAFELRRTGAGAATRLSEVPAATTGHRGWTFVLASAGLFMALLDNLVVTIALPEIGRDLDASIEALEWTVNAYALPFAVLLLTGAALGDRFGRRRVFACGIVVFTLASAACALSSSTEALVIARIVQGAGAAAIVPLSLTLVSAAFPVEKRGLALGAWSAIGGFAVAIGPLVGGLIVEALSWQWIFWINVPIGLIVAPLAMRRMTESYGPHGRLDLIGLVFLIPGLSALVAGVARGGTAGWGDPGVISPVVAGALLTVAFVLWELRTPTPMLTMHLFRSRAFSAANAAAFLMFFGIFGTIFLLAQFLQEAQGYSPLEAGIRALPWTAMPILLSAVAGILAERIGGRPLMAAGLAMQAVAVGWIAAVVESDVEYITLLAPFILGGIGMSLFFAPAAVVILGAVRPEEEGQASGATNAIRELGLAFGIAALATVFVSTGSNETPQEFADGLAAAAWVAAAALGVAFLLTLLIPRRRADESREELSSPVAALGNMAPVTSEHAIVSAAQATAQWELRSVPLSEADAVEPGEWEPFAVAQDRLYLRRAAGRSREAAVESKGAT